jgi:hypothetical protein
MAMNPRRIGLWLLSLATAAVMVAEATLQIGGRSVAIEVGIAALAVWAGGLACLGRRPKLAGKGPEHA